MTQSLSVVAKLIAAIIFGNFSYADLPIFKAEKGEGFFPASGRSNMPPAGVGTPRGKLIVWALLLLPC